MIATLRKARFIIVPFVLKYRVTGRAAAIPVPAESTSARPWPAALRGRSRHPRQKAPPAYAAMPEGGLRNAAGVRYPAPAYVCKCLYCNAPTGAPQGPEREHTSELQSLMRISYAVFCLKKKKNLIYKKNKKTTIEQIILR